MRTPTWKLNVNPRNAWELYDLRADPCEMNNRIDDSDQRPTVDALLDALRRWQARTGDALRLR